MARFTETRRLPLARRKAALAPAFRETGRGHPHLSEAR